MCLIRPWETKHTDWLEVPQESKEGQQCNVGKGKKKKEQQAYPHDFKNYHVSKRADFKGINL